MHVNALNAQKNLSLSCIPRGKNVEDATHEVEVTGTPSISLSIMCLTSKLSVSVALPMRAHMPCSACLLLYNPCEGTLNTINISTPSFDVLSS